MKSSAIMAFVRGSTWHRRIPLTKCQEFGKCYCESVTTFHDTVLTSKKSPALSHCASRASRAPVTPPMTTLVAASITLWGTHRFMTDTLQWYNNQPIIWRIISTYIIHPNRNGTNGWKFTQGKQGPLGFKPDFDQSVWFDTMKTVQLVSLVTYIRNRWFILVNAHNSFIMHAYNRLYTIWFRWHIAQFPGKICLQWQWPLWT